MKEIDRAIAFFEEEELMYLDEDDEENAVYCGLAIMALQERKARLLGKTEES